MKSSYTRRPLRQQGSESTEKRSFFRKSKGETKKEDDVFFQTKLAIGEKDDKHEKEANEVAGKVQKKAEEEKEPAVDNKEEENKEAAIQKLDNKDEEKHLQKKDEEKKEKETPVEKMEKKEEEKPSEKMGDSEKKDEKTVQKKEAGPKEKDTTVMSASKTGDAAHSSNKVSLEDRILMSKGKGLPLPGDVRKNMESELKADLSLVRIHTDEDAIDMNKELNSLAFTNEYDIYFNDSQYQPYSVSGKALLAHELTHVIQQTRISKKNSTS